MRPQTPACPRCGYDLSGSVASWHEACPLEGTCPECGLGFEWTEIYRPLLRAPRWSFEHAEARFPRALLSTALRVQWPWTFWRQVRMEHPIVPPRLAALALLGTLAAHAALATAAWIARVALSETSRLVAAPMVGRRFGALSTAQLEGVSALWPLGRWTAFDGVWILRDSIYILRPMALVTLDAKAATVLAAAMLLPLTFFLVPATLKQAKVRAGHIARIAAYGIVFLPAALFASQLAVLPGMVMALVGNLVNTGPGWERAAGALSTGYGWLAAALLLGAYVLFWGLACRRYLRLERGWVVVPVLAVLSLLASLTATVLVGGGPWVVRLLQF